MNYGTINFQQLDTEEDLQERIDAPFRVGPDVRPEQGIIVDVVIVAREHIGAERRNLARDQQQPVRAARADASGSRGSSSTVPSGVLLASTPAAAAA